MQNMQKCTRLAQAGLPVCKKKCLAVHSTTRDVNKATDSKAKAKAKA